MSKLLSRWKPLNTPALASATGKAVALNTAARTKRDGGLKSPGKPSMPAPMPKLWKVLPSNFTTASW
jgi:hypothetical protein